MDDVNSSICRIFCTAANGAELHPFRLRIRRSQVRVLPSAPLKVLQNAEKREASSEIGEGFGSSGAAVGE
jgi:hypothetical protein